MKTLKIPVHSLIDLITNSSTEIFVDCSDSVKPAKELLQEMLKVHGSDKNVDDVFEITLEEDSYNVESWFDYNFEYDGDSEVYAKYKAEYKLDEGDYENKQKNLSKLIDDYKAGKCDDIEIDSYHVQKHLSVKSNDPKYDHLLTLLNTFLTSPDHYEYSNG